MKVTSFFPEIFVKDIEKVSESYVNDLGFEVTHKHENNGSKYYILKNEPGDRIALVSYDDDNASEGFLAMRINVDNIDEGVQYFLERGYRNPGSVKRGGAADIHGKARYEMMISPEGYDVDIVEHIKD